MPLDAPDSEGADTPVMVKLYEALATDVIPPTVDLAVIVYGPPMAKDCVPEIEVAPLK